MNKGIRARQLSSGVVLPKEFFTSERIFQAARQQIFRNDWHCVGRIGQLQPRQFLRATIAGEEICTIREGDGRIRSFLDACSHRGHPIFPASGNLVRGETLICPYHGSAFRYDGANVHGSCNGCILPPLSQFATDTWEGFVFVTLSRNPKPFAKCFPQLIGRFREWRLGELRVGAERVYLWSANWMLIAQNFSECCHCDTLHPKLAALIDSQSGFNDLIANGTFGGPMSLRDGVRSLTANGGQTERPVIEGLPESKQREVYFYALFPCMFLSLHPDYVLVHILEPLGPTTTRVRCLWLFHSAAGAYPEDDAIDFWHGVNTEDQSACERTQSRMSSLEYPGGAYLPGEGVSATIDAYCWRRMFPYISRLPRADLLVRWFRYV